MCLGNKAVDSEIFVVFLGVVIFVDFGFLFEEGIQTSPSAFPRSALIV